MKLRKAIKKIVALGAGASMVGATIMGAMAADMSTYPAPFVKDGMFDAMIVVGDNAKASDVIGAVDVATSLQYSMKQTTTVSAAGGVTQVALTGDNVEIGMPGDMLEIDEFIGDNRETITGSELEGLRSGFISTSEGSTDYNQYLRLKDSDNDLNDANATGNMVTFGKDEDDNVGDSLYFKKGEPVFVYELEFEEGLESDIGSDDELEDIEDKSLEIFGKVYSMIASEVSGDQLTLELISGEILDSLEEGETKTYTIDGVDYEVEVIVINDHADPATVKFRINDEVTDSLEDGDTDTLADGLEIGIRDVMPNEAGDITPDMVEFYLGANKMILVDNDYTSEGFNQNVEINGETVDRLEVEIRAENGTSNFRIDSIKFLMDAEGVDGDIYIAPGHGLREYLDEPEGMIHEGWDIVYEGLTDPGKQDIVFDPQGDEAYDLEFVTVDGKVYDMPLATNEDGVFKLGTDDEKLVLEEATVSNTSMVTGTVIAEDDYFVLADEGTQTDKTSSHVMTFDSFRLSDSQLKFTDLAGGSKTISYTEDVSGEIYATALLTIGGSTYDVKLLNETTTGLNISDSDSTGDARIVIDLNHDDTIDGSAVGITTKGGAMISFDVSVLNDDANLTGDFTVTIATDAPNFDTEPATDEDITFDIVNRSNNEIGISSVQLESASFLEQLEDNEDYENGLTPYGVKVVVYDPSGTDEAEELTLEYPLAQVGAQVFVTAGKVASTTVGSGGAVESVTLEAIEVGSAVLASEVANVAGQNLMMVGGPCANEAARKVMGVTMDNCAEGFAPGKAILKLYDTGAGNVALLIAGDQPMDTRAAARVLANYDSYDLSGDEVSITYTSLADITVSEVV